MNWKKLVILFSGVGLVAPSFSSAHVKWFAEPFGQGRSYEILDEPVIAWIIISVLVLVFGYYLEKKLSIPTWLKGKMANWAPYALSIASIGFGVSFLLFAYNGFIFAPNLPLPPDHGLVILEYLVGLMLILGLLPRLAGILILVMYGIACIKFGTIELLDACEMLGVALFLIFAGRPKWRIFEIAKVRTWFSKFDDYAVPILRVATGLNLMILGFTEKILAPSLTADFLSTYHWNFMHAFGMSDYWFAFSAGMAEFLIGLMLFLGLSTRITTIALAAFLSTTLILLGPVELVGHLPHFSLAVVLLVLGSGNKFKLAQ